MSETVTFAKTISLDLIGFGLSDKPSINYDLESHRKYLIGFLDALNIQKATLVGSSMGASIALYTAAKSPERIAGLVVFAPSAYPGSMRYPWPADIFYQPGLPNRMLRTIVGSKLFRILFPKSLGIQAIDSSNSYNLTYVNLIQTIEQPVLIVWSRGETPIPFIYSEQYKKSLKKLEIH